MTVVTRLLALCLGYIQTIKVTDIIDITIIAYLIYHALMLARKSRTGQVLKGVFLVLIALFLSYQFNLHVLNFILTKVIEIGVFALIVLFQPELRRLLESMGTKGVFRIFTQESRASNIEHIIYETVDAVRTMSADKVGALIVFERDSILDESAKSGTIIDAEVSSELLKNIFWPKAPLHDGAVIIRHGRVHSAGCVLPLTSNINISRELGTRHRAGIGVSEHSDAVVAIVSEETGAISVAVGGMLKRHLTPETMERLLRNELMSDPEDKSTEEKTSIRLLFKRKKEGNGNAD